MCLLFSLFWRIDAVTALVLLVVSSELIYFLWPFSLPFLPSCDRCDSKKYIITGVYALTARAQGWERVDSSVFERTHALRMLIARTKVSLFRFPWGCPSAFPWFVLPPAFSHLFLCDYSCAVRWEVRRLQPLFVLWFARSNWHLKVERFFFVTFSRFFHSFGFYQGLYL